MQSVHLHNLAKSQTPDVTIYMCNAPVELYVEKGILHAKVLLEQLLKAIDVLVTFFAPTIGCCISGVADFNLLTYTTAYSVADFWASGVYLKEKGLHCCSPLYTGRTGEIRTRDQRIKSPLLYRLSYRPIFMALQNNDPQFCWIACCQKETFGNVYSSKPQIIARC